MTKTPIALLLALTVVATEGLCQRKGSRRFAGEPILTDSLSTVFIPTIYNEEFLSTNKIALWGSYYANIISYNFRTDTYRKVFKEDTFIKFPTTDNVIAPTRHDDRKKNITRNWVFLLVKATDTNSNGRIDERDPSLLFAVSPDGETLRQLTNETENVVSFDNFEAQGFLLIKIQRDANNDKSFRTDDNEFYFRKVNLKDLTLGKVIEIN